MPLNVFQWVMNIQMLTIIAKDCGSVLKLSPAGSENVLGLFLERGEYALKLLPVGNGYALEVLPQDTEQVHMYDLVLLPDML
jgi:hypothetical protein